ncbi:uncharacterized protein LODBEIA_P39760 [Lodderomyces beijingensis]|uniref:HMG box domain-containing protein n=1 Tax=Lodderomyces beijingensis TaxID=1775926 RepID=A0ABP0ZU01_9ASCO
MLRQLSIARPFLPFAPLKTPIRLLATNGPIAVKTTNTKANAKARATTKAKPSKQLTQLQAKLSKAKEAQKQTSEALKLKQQEIKQAIKQRKQKQDLLAKREQDKATRKPRPYRLVNLYMNQRKGALQDAHKAISAFSSDERQKWQQAVQEFNRQAARFFTPKPTFGPRNAAQRYLKENLQSIGDDSHSPAERLTLVMRQWKALPESEKLKYGVDKSQVVEMNRALKDWRNSRVVEYRKYLDFKKNYKLDLDDY